MRNKFILIFIFLALGCKTEKQNDSSNQEKKNKDNQELIVIYKADQNERKPENINWKSLHENDSIRRIRVQQLLDSGKVNTGKDFAKAAMIFQHGDDSTSYAKAIELIKKAIEIDTTINNWLFAAATDRYLLSIGKPQIYGTQYYKEEGSYWILENYDSLKISDKERKKYGVRTLKQQRAELQKMNSQ